MIAIKTGDGGDDGTDSDVKIQLYDINGKPVGGEFEITEQLHDFTGNALANGSYQIGIFSIPEPDTVNGLPDIYFVNVTMEGSDQWKCDYIQVAPGPEDWQASEANTILLYETNIPAAAGMFGNQQVVQEWAKKLEALLQAGARFEFNDYFSTDTSEGKNALQIARHGYDPKTIGAPTPADRTSSSFNFTNNISGTASINSVAEEIKTVRQESVSLTNGEGGSVANAISVGVKVGYKAGREGGPEASVSTTYSSKWSKWHSAQTARDLVDTSSETYTFPSSPVPAHTLRISEVTVSYKVDVITVSDGVNKPVKVELIKKEGFGNTTNTPHDITSDNARAEWPERKAKVLAADPLRAHELQEYEKDMAKAGWL